MNFEELKAYLEKEEPDEILLHLGDYVLYMQTCDDGYDYTIFGADTKKDIDGGRIDVEDGEAVPMWEALLQVNEGVVSLFQDMELLPLDQVEEYMC